jgi:hypothetical protein
MILYLLVRELYSQHVSGMFVLGCYCFKFCFSVFVFSFPSSFFFFSFLSLLLFFFFLSSYSFHTSIFFPPSFPISPLESQRGVSDKKRKIIAAQIDLGALFIIVYTSVSSCSKQKQTQMCFQSMRFFFSCLSWKIW